MTIPARGNETLSVPARACGKTATVVLHVGRTGAHPRSLRCGCRANGGCCTNPWGRPRFVNLCQRSRCLAPESTVITRPLRSRAANDGDLVPRGGTKTPRFPGGHRFGCSDRRGWLSHIDNRPRFRDSRPCRRFSRIPRGRVSAFSGAGRSPARFDPCPQQGDDRARSPSPGQTKPNSSPDRLLQRFPTKSPRRTRSRRAALGARSRSPC
jgi:hypothetical protein